MDTVRGSRGFTLIELLLSITIMSMVFGVATYAFSLFTNQWDGRLGRFDRALADYQRFDLVISALENAIPWVVRARDGQLGQYFLGRDEGLTVVTASPVFADGGIAVIRVFRERDGAEDWRLVYEEAPLTEGPLVRDDQVLPFRYRLIVVSGASSVNFRYFGWPSADVRSAAMNFDQSAVRAWQTEFDGLKKGLQPEVIGVQVGGGEAFIALPPRSDAVLGRLMVD